MNSTNSKTMSKLILNGPYEIDIHVHVIKGRDEGKVTIGMKMAEVPTQKDIDDCIEKALGVVKKQGFRLMDKTEFFNVMMRERAGATERFTLPCSNEWDR